MRRRLGLDRPALIINGIACDDRQRCGMSALHGGVLRAACARRKLARDGPRQDLRHGASRKGPREEAMRQLLKASLVMCALAPAWPAAAQVEAPAVPVEKAAFHVPVFRNEHVMLVNV